MAPKAGAARGDAHAKRSEEEEEENPITWFAAITTYLGYAVLILFGHIRDFFGKVTGQSRYFGGNSRPAKGWPPLLQDWENFYTRRLYHRIQDCWNRPIDGPPLSNAMRVIVRKSEDGNYTLQTTSERKVCVNLGSYNYLGFADDWHSSCKASVMEALERFSPCTSSSFADAGTTTLHRELENVMARFVGKPAALCYNMGYGTNSASIPALIGKGCLILSDSLNHTSIVNGSRSSGATIRVFKHNDSEQLEAMLRDAIVTGQPRTHRPWRKILVMVEGIYSMEGQIVDLKNIVRVAKQYKALVYLDEAHSIGALGATGRGACEHCGVSPDDVDILMGTFTKSFGAMGGYIAGSREFIDFLRANSAGTLYGNAMSPVVCKQILRAFEVIEGRDGTDTGAKKLRAVKENSNYFRRRLIELGAEVVGDWDSPVIPIMIYNPTKIAAFSRECLDRGLAVVVVGFPAVPLVLSRTRFCVSAGHSKEVLDKALEKVDEVLRVLKMRYRFSPFG